MENLLHVRMWRCGQSWVSPWKEPLCKSFSPLSKLFLKVWRACVMFPSKRLHACICRVKGALMPEGILLHRVMCNNSKGIRASWEILSQVHVRWTRCTFVDGALKLCVRICCFEDCSLRRCTSLSDHQSKRSCFLRLYERPLCPADGVVWVFFECVSAFRSSWVWFHNLL